jgi:UDP-N-acetylmuramoyl-L-alanyl-D-glutamate--2,6-diaminopimelate ligase
VADKEWLNNKKMTMLGRFQLQKLLSQMVSVGCKYAVIEVSSEGIKQFRHLAINFDYVVFTNLTPEHLESHGGFENYKKAKGELFAGLTLKNKKTLANRVILKISVINLDDANADCFLQFNADKKIGFSANNVGGLADFRAKKTNSFVCAKNIQVSKTGTSFEVNDGAVRLNVPFDATSADAEALADKQGDTNKTIHLKLIGAFNVENALPAIVIAENEGIEFEKIKKGLEEVSVVPGRMEFINEGQNFDVLVDYAPEPAAMGKLYETLGVLGETTPLDATRGDKPKRRVIHVLGSCGGGRDKARRPILGRMAGKKANIVIVTNEDLYDDDPNEIIDQVAEGAIQAGKKLNKDLFKILDRRVAIAKAIELATSGDLILITGKGAEQAMAVAGGKYVKWDDREVVREELLKLNE